MSAGNATARNAIPLFTKEAAYKTLGLSYNRAALFIHPWYERL